MDKVDKLWGRYGCSSPSTKVLHGLCYCCLFVVIANAFLSHVGIRFCDTNSRHCLDVGN